MPRRWQRPAGGFTRGKPGTQLVSMLTLLIVLGLIYARARDPQTWRWLAPDDATPSDSDGVKAEAATGSKSPPVREPRETIASGPTDRDAEETKAAVQLLAAISDKAPLAPAEMPAYWRLMKWARAQSFDDLARRALRDIPFTHLFEVPDKYRGQPLRLRLHIKRILEYDAPPNPLGVERVYEAWGWTDDSKSYPYVVVFSELPSGLRVGSDVQEEGVFVGYFLKTMSYIAFDKSRAAPLLVGRLRAIDKKVARTTSAGNNIWHWLAGGALLLFIGTRVWLFLSRRRQPLSRDPQRTDADSFEDWLSEVPSGGSQTAGPSIGATDAR